MRQVATILHFFEDLCCVPAVGTHTESVCPARTAHEDPTDFACKSTQREMEQVIAVWTLWRGDSCVVL